MSSKTVLPTAQITCSSWSQGRERGLFSSRTLMMKNRTPSSFLGLKSLPSEVSTQPASNRAMRIHAAVELSLPTAKPEIAKFGRVPKWSARAIRSFAMAELEARKLMFPTTGTEALLMGILVEGTSECAKFLRANGITLSNVREKAIEILGKSYMCHFSPEHPPLTEPAQRALDMAVDLKLNTGEGEIMTKHMLVGIWGEVDAAGHKILEALGFTQGKVEELTSGSS